MPWIDAIDRYAGRTARPDRNRRIIVREARITGWLNRIGAGGDA